MLQPGNRREWTAVCFNEPPQPVNKVSLNADVIMKLVPVTGSVEDTRGAWFVWVKWRTWSSDVQIIARCDWHLASMNTSVRQGGGTPRLSPPNSWASLNHSPDPFPFSPPFPSRFLLHRRPTSGFLAL